MALFLAGSDATVFLIKWYAFISTEFISTGPTAARMDFVSYFDASLDVDTPDVRIYCVKLGWFLILLVLFRGLVLVLWFCLFNIVSAPDQRYRRSTSKNF